MEPSGQAVSASASLARLLGFLDQDPDNLQLIADAAAAAFDAGELDQATAMIERYAARAPLTPQMQNLQGLALLARRDFAQAADIFQGLIEASHDSPSLRFNLAFCLVMRADYQGALPLLDETTTDALPQAAALKIQAMHHLGELDEALVAGMRMARHHPQDTGLMAALSLVAVDARQVELAREFATRAGDRPEGLSTLGTLALDSNDLDGALSLFDQALAAQADSARALLGKGLGLMAKGEAAQAAGWLDRAGQVFGDHIGSWIAAGWAHFTAGDPPGARAAFERALAIDDNFAESHGALAVLDLAEGKTESAERRTETALRLDRNCFSAALAKSMLLSGKGEEAKAERVRELALNTRIGPDGRTLGQSMAALARAGRGR